MCRRAGRPTHSAEEARADGRAQGGSKVQPHGRRGGPGRGGPGEGDRRAPGDRRSGDQPGGQGDRDRAGLRRAERPRPRLRAGVRGCPDRRRGPDGDQADRHPPVRRAGGPAGRATAPPCPAVRVDLHTHSTASDGVLPPADLVRAAREHGVGVLALTDHDTTDGVAEALDAGRAYRVDVIPGVEINTDVDAYEVHVLGYFIDHTQQEFQRFLGRMRAGRVGSVQEAFERFLSRSGPAYVPRTRLLPEEAVETIRSAGGVPVLAHPGWEASGPVIERVPALVARGLCGIEVYYPDHTPAMVSAYLDVVRRYGLIATGGTDFHGGGIATRVALGSVPVPAEAVAALRARWESLGARPRAGESRPAPERH